MERFNKLYITCILLELLNKSRKYYGMRCGKTSVIMTCSSDTSASCSLEVRHFGNLLIESTSEIQMSVTFLLVNENIKFG